MKKTLLIIILAASITGCNINPNKEARIKKLETEILTVTKNIEILENRIQTLDVINEQFKIRIHELEKQ